MGLTLLEASKLVSGDVQRAAIIELFAESSDILRAIEFNDVPGGALKYDVEGALPGIAFRGVNEAYTESTGVINPATEPLKIVGGDLDVDRSLIKTRGAGIRSVHVAMKVKAMAQKIHYTIIKGDSTTNPKEFDGLQARLTGSQVISNSGASGGAGLSMEKLDEAIDTVDSPTHLIMTKALARRLDKASKSTSLSGTINFEKDDFGRRMRVYNDLPVLIADANDIAAANAALGANESYTGGGTANGTSVYVVSFRDGMLEGLQNEVMEVEDLGHQDAKPVVRTRVEWLVSIALLHPRAACRLRDINQATAAVA